jgi:hypothetical protein
LKAQTFLVLARRQGADQPRCGAASAQANLHTRFNQFRRPFGSSEFRRICSSQRLAHHAISLLNLRHP